MLRLWNRKDLAHFSPIASETLDPKSFINLKLSEAHEPMVLGNVIFGCFGVKVLFTHRCRRQNVCPSFLLHVDSCVESIYIKEKTRTKVLPSATVGEKYFS